ncbi:dipeptidase [Candidatus Uabimicrobium amorphum]|uniref:Dipeptidase n=1 Tax=Uabimicrobium amorphum TaxID=2596890 RepID=A0A5S9F432_UABAM|nr:dipeptidase [Candidatus Uabimicrobium amorphum]BBM85387.1 dipeptidase [Candidatus Uabimicrobium amorphum]
MFHKNSLPIFDGHNDSLARFFYRHDERQSFFDMHTVGHIDFPRLQQANFMGGLFAVFVPAPDEKATSRDKSKLAPALDTIYAYQHTCKMIEFMEKICEHPQVFRFENASDLQKCYEEKCLAIVLHFEGAEAIIDLDKLEFFYEKGLRSLGLVWSRPNQYGVGVPFVFPHTPDIGPGLTDKGKELVKRCDELGIVVDVSHLNQKGFWDVAKISQKPLVATHSNVHAICRSPRNLLDDQIKAIADSGGVIGINLGVPFIREDGKINRNTSLKDIVAHFDYIAKKVGVDHVAFGSDLDGMYMAKGVKDVTGLPKIIARLHENGYSEDDLCKMAYKNWFRILRLL